MTHLVCPRCQRANPGEAYYCYFDGFSLRLGAGVAPASPGSEQLTQHFAFPSGRLCKSFDELVQGCQVEWEAARTLLQSGEFTRYLQRLGRLDFARAAQEAQGEPDPDVALYNFVSQLPAAPGQGPRLELNPRRLMLGKVRAGELRQVRLTISNQGKGLLQGRINVADGGQWLKVVDGTNDTQFPVRTAGEQILSLQVDPRGLASGNSYSAKLTAITNGGIAEVPVRLDLNAAAFPKPPFQGAASPRALAEKMRATPKPAVPLLESGEVAAWFRQNGWTYPVAGTAARGVASVQQFFEGMGLSKPPPLELSEKEFRFTCEHGETLAAHFTLRTSAKKWVYGQVESDAAWLTVLTPNVSGAQQAAVRFEVNTASLDSAASHEGQVFVTANAGQKLAVRVVVAVRAPRKALARNVLRPLFRVALLAFCLRLLLLVPGDLSARLLLAPTRTDAGKGSVAFWRTAAASDETFLKHFVLATWWVGPLGGVGWVWRRGGRFTDLLCGLVAGGGGGVIVAATLGCVMDYLDLPPRLLLFAAPGSFADQSPGLSTTLWFTLTLAWWCFLGGVSALPFVWFCRLCGLQRLADLLGL